MDTIFETYLDRASARARETIIDKRNNFIDKQLEDLTMDIINIKIEGESQQREKELIYNLLNNTINKLIK